MPMKGIAEVTGDPSDVSGRIVCDAESWVAIILDDECDSNVAAPENAQVGVTTGHCGMSLG